MKKKQWVLCLVGLFWCANVSAETSDSEKSELEKTEALNEIKFAEALKQDTTIVSPNHAHLISVSSKESAFLPDISAVLTMGFWYFSDEPTPRLAAHEPSHETHGLRFDMQEFELAFQSNIDPYIRGECFLALGLHSVEIEECFLRTVALPWNLQAKLGSFYAEFGRFNTQHFLETQPFVDMPLVNRRFWGGEQWRGLGFEVSWITPLPWFSELVFDMITAGNEVSLNVPLQATETLADFVHLINFKQFFPLSDTWSILWGLSMVVAPNNARGHYGASTGHGHDAHQTDGSMSLFRDAQCTIDCNTYDNGIGIGIGELNLDDHSHFFGSDLYVKWRDHATIRSVALQSEYIMRHSNVGGDDYRESGFYTQIMARLSKHWEIAGRFDLIGLFSSKPSAHGHDDYASHASPATDDMPTDDMPTDDMPTDDMHADDMLLLDFTPVVQQRIGGAISYYFSEFQRWRLQYNYDIYKPAMMAHDRNVHEVFLQYQFVMGAHGAHPF